MIPAIWCHWVVVIAYCGVGFTSGQYGALVSLTVDLNRLMIGRLHPANLPLLSVVPPPPPPSCEMQFTSLQAESFPQTLACPGLYIHRSIQRWILNIFSCQSGLPMLLFTLCSKLIESMRILACMIWLTLLEAVQRGEFKKKKTFYNGIVPMGFLSHRKFGLLSPGNTNCDRVMYPTYSACWVL